MAQEIKYDRKNVDDFNVQHWRLFADEHWNPILPRGEVYSSKFTEIGWKSASEIFELTGQQKPESTVDPT